MKKIAIVLLMALALVSIATAEVVVSGEFDYGFMSDGDEYAGSFDKIEIDLTASIDEYNTFEMELEDKNKSDDIGDTVAFINFAKVITDWSGLFSLPISVSTEIGYNDYSIGDNDITQYSYENFKVGTDKSGGGVLELGFNEMISLSAGVIFDPDAGNNADGKTASDAAFSATVDYAPVKITASYSTVKDGYFYMEGVLGLEAGPGMLDAQAMLWTDNDSDATDAYGYGVGVNYGIADAVIGVSFKGMENQSAEFLGLSVGYALNEIVGIDLGTNFYLGDSDLVSKDTFLGLDASVSVAASDSVSYRVGYLYSDGHGKLAKLNSITYLADGGGYMSVKVDY